MDNTTGHCIVSEETLAKEAGCSRETVSRNLKRGFDEQGLGKWLRRKKARNRQGHWYYGYEGVIPEPCAYSAQGTAIPRAHPINPCADKAHSGVRKTHSNYLENYLELGTGGWEQKVADLLKDSEATTLRWLTDSAVLLKGVDPRHLDPALVASAIRQQPTLGKAWVAQVNAGRHPSRPEARRKVLRRKPRHKRPDRSVQDTERGRKEGGV